MPNCSICDGFSERFNIPNLREYQEIVKQLFEIVNHGTFLLINGTCPLEDMLKTPLPGDSVSHNFQCFACGRKFELSADTYHGGASWNVGDLPEPATGDSQKPN
jgi:hypothetical protein